MRVSLNLLRKFTPIMPVLRLTDDVAASSLIAKFIVEELDERGYGEQRSYQLLSEYVYALKMEGWIKNYKITEFKDTESFWVVNIFLRLHDRGSGLMLVEFSDLITK